MNLEELKVVDADVAAAIEAEMDRQNSHIELIASENWVSDAVMEAQGSIMTNKYAEGYPGKRYYGGCQCVDVVENLAIERAKELFDAEYVNVQPHSDVYKRQATWRWKWSRSKVWILQSVIRRQSWQQVPSW